MSGPHKPQDCKKFNNSPESGQGLWSQTPTVRKTDLLWAIAGHDIMHCLYCPVQTTWKLDRLNMVLGVGGGIHYRRCVIKSGGSRPNMSEYLRNPILNLAVKNYNASDCICPNFGLLCVWNNQSVTCSDTRTKFFGVGCRKLNIAENAFCRVFKTFRHICPI